jgi:hypothetical protein
MQLCKSLNNQPEIPEAQVAPGVEQGQQEPGMASPQGTPPGAPQPPPGGAGGVETLLAQLGI